APPHPDWTATPSSPGSADSGDKPTSFWGESLAAVSVFVVVGVTRCLCLVVRPGDRPVGRVIGRVVGVCHAVDPLGELLESADEAHGAPPDSLRTDAISPRLCSSAGIAPSAVAAAGASTEMT